MNLAEETAIRERAAYLALRWHDDAVGPFKGDTAQDFATMIVAAHIIADESRLSLHRWIDAGRRAGMSWSDIGALIGISKQAAQQRFGGGSDEKGIATPGEISVKLGATAFNEMTMLAREGAEGRELISTGALTLVFRQTDTTWEYQRNVGVGANIKAMNAAGWSYVSNWFVFHYFKRPVEG